MKTRAALILLGLVLAACGADRADQETPGETEDREGVIEPMTDAVDDATAVEDRAMQEKDDIDQAVEEAEEPAEDPPGGEQAP